MPYPIVQSAILEFQIVGLLDGQTTRNVFHYGAEITTPPLTDGESAATEFVTTWVASFWDDWRAAISTQWSLNYIQSQWIRPTRYRLLKFSAIDLGILGTGSVAQPSTPSGAAGVVSLYEPIATRAHQGRRFIPGLPTNFITQSQLNNTGLGPYEQLGLDFTSPVILVTNPAIMHPTLRRVNYSGTVSDKINGHFIHRPVRYQRRREVGRGE